MNKKNCLVVCLSYDSRGILINIFCVINTFQEEDTMSIGHLNDTQLPVEYYDLMLRKNSDAHSVVGHNNNIFAGGSGYNEILFGDVAHFCSISRTQYENNNFDSAI